MFALQLWFGLRLDGDAADVGAARGVCVLVVVCFLIGIARAWELIGGPSIGFRRQVVGAFRDHERADD